MKTKIIREKPRLSEKSQYCQWQKERRLGALLFCFEDLLTVAAKFEFESSGDSVNMEAEGRAYSDLYRNSSEELFLKTIMESPIGKPVPTLEMLEFKSASQNLRTDSEELFKRWLTNGEASSLNLDHLFYLKTVCQGSCFDIKVLIFLV